MFHKDGILAEYQDEQNVPLESRQSHHYENHQEKRPKQDEPYYKQKKSKSEKFDSHYSHSIKTLEKGV